MAQSLGTFVQIRRAFDSRVGHTHKNQKCVNRASVKVKKISINNFSRKIFYVIHLGNNSVHFLNQLLILIFMFLTFELLFMKQRHYRHSFLIYVKKVIYT